ncbi:MAG: efflux RND transporter periplasmic adaptor subunit [Acidobacteriota bacterium]|nr:efflux RND transporter periplasmic adaptor subunit [Acidobacteriota bacterium]
MPLLLAGAGLPACSPQAREEKIEFRVPVRVQAVGTADVEDGIVATGSVRASEVVALTVESPGLLEIARLKEGGRRLAEGDLVTRGQAIAAIRGEEVRLAARTESTERRYLTALRDYDSKKKLFEAGLIAEQELIAAEAALADARLEVERSRYTEKQTRLVSPIAGVILELARDATGQPLADGQRVTAGFTVARIAPLDPVVADVDILGPDIARVRVGLPARVRHHGWPDHTFPGHVLRLAPTLDPKTRSLRVEVEVANPDLVLRPGMFVEATLIAETREGVTVVPREAVTERSGRKVVFVLRGQRVAEREVRLGLGDDDVVEVLSGVEPGEKIVVKGLETLADESRVRVTGS